MKDYRCTSVTIVLLSALLVAPAAWAVDLQANLYTENPDYLVVKLEADDIASDETLHNINFTVRLITSANEMIEGQYRFADKALGTGGYVNYIPHGQEDVSRIEAGEFTYSISTPEGEADVSMRMGAGKMGLNALPRESDVILTATPTTSTPVPESS